MPAGTGVLRPDRVLGADLSARHRDAAAGRHRLDGEHRPDDGGDRARRSHAQRPARVTVVFDEQAAAVERQLDVAVAGGRQHRDATGAHQRQPDARADGGACPLAAQRDQAGRWTESGAARRGRGASRLLNGRRSEGGGATGGATVGAIATVAPAAAPARALRAVGGRAPARRPQRQPRRDDPPAPARALRRSRGDARRGQRPRDPASHRSPTPAARDAARRRPGSSPAAALQFRRRRARVSFARSLHFFFSHGAAVERDGQLAARVEHALLDRRRVRAQQRRRFLERQALDRDQHERGAPLRATGAPAARTPAAALHARARVARATRRARSASPAGDRRAVRCGPARAAAARGARRRRSGRSGASRSRSSRRRESGASPGRRRGRSAGPDRRARAPARSRASGGRTPNRGDAGKACRTRRDRPPPRPRPGARLPRPRRPPMGGGSTRSMPASRRPVPGQADADRQLQPRRRVATAVHPANAHPIAVDVEARVRRRGASDATAAA